MPQLQAIQGRTSETRIDIPTWKWNVINMDFITGLLRTRKQHDSIWVIVYRITKCSHFLAVKTTYPAEDYARIYINKIVRLHGVPLSIRCLCVSSQIEVLSLPLISGSHFRKVLVLKLTLVQHFIHRQMGSQSIPFRP